MAVPAMLQTLLICPHVPQPWRMAEPSLLGGTHRTCPGATKGCHEGSNTPLLSLQGTTVRMITAVDQDKGRPRGIGYTIVSGESWWDTARGTVVLAWWWSSAGEHNHLQA